MGEPHEPSVSPDDDTEISDITQSSTDSVTVPDYWRVSDLPSVQGVTEPESQPEERTGSHRLPKRRTNKALIIFNATLAVIVVGLLAVLIITPQTVVRYHAQSEKRTTPSSPAPMKSTIKCMAASAGDQVQGEVVGTVGPMTCSFLNSTASAVLEYVKDHRDAKAFPITGVPSVMQGKTYDFQCARDQQLSRCTAPSDQGGLIEVNVRDSY